MMAKLVLILANQNALIWGISFDEILEMILPKVLLGIYFVLFVFHFYLHRIISKCFSKLLHEVLF